MICTSCIFNFFHDPIKVGVIVASLIISLALLYYSRNAITSKRKVSAVYGHIFFLGFPVFFYIFFSGCSAVLQACQQLAPVLITIALSILSGIALVSVLGPILFIKKHMKASYTVTTGLIPRLIEKHAQTLNIDEPQVHVVDTAEPKAFSLSAIKSKIFISVGLMDLLTNKELEAVLLHELGHIKHKSSSIKFLSFLAKNFNPLASFEVDAISQEEQKADLVAQRIQHGSKYLNRAKRKIKQFLEFTQT